MDVVTPKFPWQIGYLQIISLLILATCNYAGTTGWLRRWFTKAAYLIYTSVKGCM
jgi:hypothetical protein